MYLSVIATGVKTRMSPMVVEQERVFMFAHLQRGGEKSEPIASYRFIVDPSTAPHSPCQEVFYSFQELLLLQSECNRRLHFKLGHTNVIHNAVLYGFLCIEIPVGVLLLIDKLQEVV